MDLAWQGISLRGVTVHDMELVAYLYTKHYPFEPKSADLWGYFWTHRREAWEYADYLLYSSSGCVGIISVAHAPWEQDKSRFAFLNVVVPIEVRTPLLYQACLSEAESIARKLGARTALFDCHEDEEDIIALVKKTYKRECLYKGWELDLIKHKAKIIRETKVTRKNMSSMGIELTTLKKDHHVDKFAQLYVLHQQSAQDVPHTAPYIPMSFEEWLKRFKEPDVRTDRLWMARALEEIVGFSFLRYPPSVGSIWTGLTATHRDYRNRGIAKAVKNETLYQALRLGAQRVRTDNAESNLAIIHINTLLGYERIPGIIEFSKDLT